MQSGQERGIYGRWTTLHCFERLSRVLWYLLHEASCICDSERSPDRVGKKKRKAFFESCADNKNDLTRGRTWNLLISDLGGNRSQAPCHWAIRPVDIYC